jgi:putative transposase
MVRAGVVAHPAEWPWCSYGEWMGQRRRYGVVDFKECLPVLGGATPEQCRANYQALIRTRLAQDVMARQPQWTESIAVGASFRGVDRPAGDSPAASSL